jgi:hypothetical protein
MDDWGFEHLDAWLQRWVKLPIGPLFCVISAPPTDALGSDRRSRRTTPDRG